MDEVLGALRESFQSIDLRAIIVAVGAEDGRTWWEHPWKTNDNQNIVDPIIDGDTVFVSSGYRAGCAMLKVTKSDDGFTVKELFAGRQCNSQMNPAILFQGHLYANSNSNRARDGMLCMDLDGKVLWQTGRQPNFQRGHMLGADGMIYVIDGVRGSLHLMEPSPKGYKELARAEGLLGGPEIWAPLSLSDGKLIIRDQSKMLCLDVKAK